MCYVLNLANPTNSPNPKAKTINCFSPCVRPWGLITLSYEIKELTSEKGTNGHCDGRAGHSMVTLRHCSVSVHPMAVLATLGRAGHPGPRWTSDVKWKDCFLRIT
jgi:hypothetical protein